MKDWRMPISRHFIREWGVSRGFELIDDRGPVIDNKAAYVGPFGSKIFISGLARDGRYRIWIDFVRFRSIKKQPDSVLKIAAMGPGMEPRLIDTVRYSNLNDSYYFVDIPLSLSARGSVEISFIEYSTEPGNWGVWDIIVSGTGELPNRADIPGDESIYLEINDRIVQ